jgi:hypothetical protein
MNVNFKEVIDAGQIGTALLVIAVLLLYIADKIIPRKSKK